MNEELVAKLKQAFLAFKRVEREDDLVYFKGLINYREYVEKQQQNIDNAKNEFFDLINSLSNWEE